MPEGKSGGCSPAIFFVVNMSVESLRKPQNPVLRTAKRVIFHVMRFFRCNRIFACPNPAVSVRAGCNENSIHPAHT
jgi:hypothetical protein